MDCNNVFLDQILHLKQQIEKKHFFLENKEKSFAELYQFVMQKLPMNDKNGHQRLRDIIANKQKQDQNVINTNPQTISNIIQEKEKLQSELEKALNDIDHLKTLLAQNTIKSLYTQEDDDDEDRNQIDFQTVPDKQNSSLCKNDRDSDFENKKLSKSFNLGRPKLKQKSKVPGLDFSNLKQVKDYKDWYSYSKKLEDAIRLLRERIKHLESENDDLETKRCKAVT